MGGYCYIPEFQGSFTSVIKSFNSTPSLLEPLYVASTPTRLRQLATVAWIRLVHSVRSSIPTLMCPWLRVVAAPLWLSFTPWDLRMHATNRYRSVKTRIRTGFWHRISQPVSRTTSQFTNRFVCSGDFLVLVTIGVDLANFRRRSAHFIRTDCKMYSLGSHI